MLMTTLSRQLGCDAMKMSSDAGNNAVRVTWPGRDDDAESCW
jgi:hypothetical protein